jgi:predicted N-acetyltransferase YhbS
LSQSFSHHAQPYSLTDYGWDEACEHAFAPHRAAGLIPARVVRAERGSCEAVTDAEIVRAEIPGTADHGNPLSAPCTGDWAALRSVAGNRAPMLHATLRRRTALVRSSSSHISHGQALAAHRTEIDTRREHGGDYTCAVYILRPHDHTPENETMTTWTVRSETPEDIPAIRDILLAAFPTALEADIVDALRADPKAWIDGLSMVTAAADGTATGYALLTRCHVDGAPALALAPCAVLPSAQRTGAGSAAIRAALDAARAMGENLVLVLGHADYYPRFGFTPASRFGIRAPFEVPDEAMMAMALDNTRTVPVGTIQYPAAFGV